MLKKVVISLLITYFLHNVSAAFFEECKPNRNGIFLAVANSCYEYIYCNGSDSFQDSCPMDSYFDAEVKECIFSDSFICDLPQISNFNASFPTSPTTTTVTASPNGEFMEANIFTGKPQCKRQTEEYFPHGERCEYYYKCVRGFLSVQRCNLNYGWDYLQQICLPIEQSKCYKKKGE